MNNQVIEMGSTGERLLTATQYADRHGVTHRTVKRWIQDGKFAGVATRDGQGRWLLPADALPADSAPTPAPQAEVLPLVVGTQLDAPAVVDAPAPVAPVGAVLATSTAFLDLETASALLGVPVGAIRRNAEYFGAVPFGKHGALVVPAGTVRKVAGL